MRNHIVILLGIALALPVVTDPASAARKPRPEVRELRQARTFSAVGEYTGELGGTIYFNGASYRLAPEVMIYEVGHGTMPRGTMLIRRMMAVSGVTLGGSEIVYQIIVRSDQMSVDEGPIKAVPAGMSGPE